MNLQCAYPWFADSNSIKNIQKKSAGGTILFIAQNEECTDVHHFFDQSTVNLITFMFLVSKMYYRISKLCKNNNLLPCC